MIVLVTGDRHWGKMQRLFAVLDEHHEHKEITLLIHGGARGADTLAGAWAKSQNVPCSVFPAEWAKYGRAAGPIRNREMLGYPPDLVIGFHENIEESKGTADCLDEAAKRGIEIRFYDK